MNNTSCIGSYAIVEVEGTDSAQSTPMTTCPCCGKRFINYSENGMVRKHKAAK